MPVEFLSDEQAAHYGGFYAVPKHCALRLDILLFLGCEVDEELPWHSTVSRTRQLFPAVVFERLFDHVFAQCVTRGLAAGDMQAVDSAPVKANASLDGLREKQPAGGPGPVLAAGPSAGPVGSDGSPAADASHGPGPARRPLKRPGRSAPQSVLAEQQDALQPH